MTARFMFPLNRILVVLLAMLLQSMALPVTMGHPLPSTTTPLVWPLSGTTAPDIDAITSPFGPRWQASQARYDYHPGIDLAAPLDTPVHAAAEGTITKVGWLSSSAGLSVIIHHPSLELYTAYLHLNGTTVAVGQGVEQGETIGYVGESGDTAFVHLHFEVRLSTTDYPKSTRNPLGYLPHPDAGAPALSIVSLNADPLYSPTVSLLITSPRQELDVNALHITLRDRQSGTLLVEQHVDFNERLHTGSDTLEQDGIRLIPGHFNRSTQEYQLTVELYQVQASDAFTLTAEVRDLAGHARVVIGVATANPLRRRLFLPAISH